MGGIIVECQREKSVAHLTVNNEIGTKHVLGFGIVAKIAYLRHGEEGVGTDTIHITHIVEAYLGNAVGKQGNRLLARDETQDVITDALIGNLV